MCKNYDRPPDQKSRFFIASKGVPQENLKRFITEYISDVKFIIS